MLDADIVVGSMKGYLVMPATIAMLVACSDRDIFSLEKYDEISSSAAIVPRVSLETTLKNVSEQHDVEFDQNRNPRDVYIERDYIATLISGDCMIIAEGDGAETMTVTVSLSVIHGGRCNDKMLQAFGALRRQLSLRDDP